MTNGPQNHAKAIRWLGADRYLFEDALVTVLYKILSPKSLGLCVEVVDIKSLSEAALEEAVIYFGKKLLEIEQPSSLAVLFRSKIAYKWSRINDDNVI